MRNLRPRRRAGAAEDAFRVDAAHADAGIGAGEIPEQYVRYRPCGAGMGEL